MPNERSDERLYTPKFLPIRKEIAAHFTGYWPPGYRPRWKRRPGWHLATMLFSLFSGVGASIFIITSLPLYWPLLVLSWMLTVHAARKAQLVILHHAVHANLTGDKQCDRIFVEIMSILLTIQGFEDYYQNHVQLHHGPKLATQEDPDVQFLLHMGFRPGMSRKALWRHLYWTMISPQLATNLRRDTQ